MSKDNWFILALIVGACLFFIGITQLDHPAEPAEDEPEPKPVYSCAEYYQVVKVTKSPLNRDTYLYDVSITLSERADGVTMLTFISQDTGERILRTPMTSDDGIHWHAVLDRGAYSDWNHGWDVPLGPGCTNPHFLVSGFDTQKCIGGEYWPPNASTPTVTWSV